MAIQLVASLDIATVTELVRELTPLTINLGEGDDSHRWMEVARPDLVELVAGEGVRIHTTATLEWTVAGVSVTFTIQSVTMMLRPVLSGGRLNVVGTIESADLKSVPDMIDRSIVTHVNARLLAKPDALGWSYAKTLAVRLPMPASMAPVERFELDARDAALEVGVDAIRISVALPMHISRKESPPERQERATR
jgi:hypothetical protein